MTMTVMMVSIIMMMTIHLEAKGGWGTLEFEWMC
jgi:hypothetical protein